MTTTTHTTTHSTTTTPSHSRGGRVGDDPFTTHTGFICDATGQTDRGASLARWFGGGENLAVELYLPACVPPDWLDVGKPVAFTLDGPGGQQRGNGIVVGAEAGGVPARLPGLEGYVTLRRVVRVGPDRTVKLVPAEG